MLKRLFIITAALLLGYGLHAQTFETSNDTTKGANGAMTIILGKATAGYPEFLTMDGRYMSGVYSGAAGYVYDFEKDTCIIFVEYTLAGYFSETHYVGQDDPSDTYSNSFVIYDGVKHELEKILNDTEKPSWNEMNVWGVSDHGEKILTMGYEEWWTSAGNKNHYNRALVHDGHTGKLIAKLPWPWAPEEILVEEDRLGFGSRADCISADGCIIGGHSTNPKANSNWTLAIWDMSDPNDIKAIGLGSKFGYNDKTFGFGSFYGVSSDGTLLAGASETSGYGVIVHYDR
ncbi:MAG: hypothetical protein K2L03_01550, partial [Bacteroidales bacterium]|nr:hypothetical protein [Bacteroidales bacterium]